MSTRMFGARIERNIDPKLLRGEGAFVDDIPRPMRCMPPCPQLVARANSRDRRGRPRSTWGRRRVHLRDIGDLDIRCLSSASVDELPHAASAGAATSIVGQTIAMVVAVDRHAAEDAAALIEIDSAPAVEIDREKAVLDGAPLVVPMPNNIAAHFVQVPAVG